MDRQTLRNTTNHSDQQTIGTPVRLIWTAFGRWGTSTANSIQNYLNPLPFLKAKIDSGLFWTAVSILEGNLPHHQPIQDEFTKKYDNMSSLLYLGRNKEFMSEMLLSAKLSSKGAMYGNAGLYEDALIILEESLKLAGGVNIEAWKNISTIYLKLSMFEKCLHASEKAIEIGLSDFGHSFFPDELRLEEIARAYTNKSAALYNTGQYREAIAACDAGLLIVPNFSRLFNNKMSSYIALGDWISAEQCADRALIMDPNYINSLYGKGIVLLHNGNYEESILYFNKITIQNEFNEKGLLGLLEAYITIGDLNMANKYYTKLKKIDKALAIKWIEATRNPKRRLQIILDNYTICTEKKNALFYGGF